MNGQIDSQAIDERRLYVEGFNKTMVDIWKEKLILLGVYNTGALYNSVSLRSPITDDKVTSVQLLHSFLMYGVYVDRGTGSNTFKGNPGDIGRDNRRTRKRWFYRKYYAATMNIKEFFAEKLGKECADTVAACLDQEDASRLGFA